MALIAWYPLNGNIENCGIGDANLTGSGETFASGKFGKGLKGNYREFKWTAEQTGKILNGKEMSFCFWIYVDAPTGTTGQSMIFGNGGMDATNNRHYSIFQYPTCNDLHLSWQRDGDTGIVSGSVNSNVFPSYKWTHCAIIVKNQHVYIYINNKLKYTGNALYQLGDKFDYETVVLRQISTRILNDFRVYNHAISQQELTDIYHACVLHYNCDDLICYNSQNRCNWQDTSTLLHAGWQGSATYDKSNHYLILDATNGWRTFGWYIPDYWIRKPVTFSFDYLVLDDANRSEINSLHVINEGTCTYGNYKVNFNALKDGKWKHITYTTQEAWKFFGINLRGVDQTGKSLIIALRNVQLEQSTKETNYKPFGYNQIPTRNLIPVQHQNKTFTKTSTDAGWKGGGLPQTTVYPGRTYTFSGFISHDYNDNISGWIDANTESNAVDANGQKLYTGNDSAHSIILANLQIMPPNQDTQFKITTKIKNDATDSHSFHTVCPQVPEGKTVNFTLKNLQFEESENDSGFTTGVRNNQIIIHDSSGFNNHATGHNISIHDDAPVGQYSLDFNGTCIKKCICNTCPQIKRDITYNCWVYQREAFPKGAQFIMSQGRDYHIFGFNLVSGNGTARLYIGTTDQPTVDVSTGISIVDGKWHMLTATYDGSQARVYIDGQQKAVRDVTGDINYAESNGVLSIGKMAFEWSSDSNYFPFNGYISDCRIFATALSATDILNLYQNKAQLNKNYIINTHTYTECENNKSNLTKKSIWNVNQLIEPATIQLNDGSQWLCILSHDIRNDIHWFNNNDDAHNCTDQNNRYSLLYLLNNSNIRSGGAIDGKYEFILEYPEIGYLGKTERYNRWKQLANPLDIRADVNTDLTKMGYESVHISLTGCWGQGMGLSSSGQAYLDCQAGKNTWFGSIGQNSIWSQESKLYMPAADGSNRKFVRLWVRTDNTNYNGIYQLHKNGSLVASEFKEN